MNNNKIDFYLENLRIEKLNPMQLATMEAFHKHQRLLLLANTGTGKTVAFLFPAILELKANEGTQVLIMVPTRELAQQIETVFKQLKTGFKITACYGGHKREIEENNLIDVPEIIVGTPGRLADHIKRGNIHTVNIKRLFLDEFDKILESGFVEEMHYIYQSLESVQQMMLISATNTIEYPHFLPQDGWETLNFLTGATQDDSKKLTHAYLKSNEKDKTLTLYEMLCFIGKRKTIIFCNHREAVERVDAYLQEKGITAVYYHGAMMQDARDTAIAKFRNGSAYYLLTTDLASRGLDIVNIRYIIHYHLPATEEIYTHRNGRTARMDASGSIVLLLSPEEHLPEYVASDTTELKLPKQLEMPDKPELVTLYLPLGKKNKISKADIVGYFIQQGQLKKEDIGIIEVKDFHSFIAIKRKKVNIVLHALKDKRIKNKKAKIEIAR